MNSVEWSHEIARLRDVKPRPIAKLYGQRGPTPDQKVEWDARMREWNRLYRHATKMQKETLVRDNAEHARRNATTCPHCHLPHQHHDKCGHR